MEPQENSNVMQGSVPVNLEPKVEPVVPEKPEKKPSKMNGMIIGMVILVVCLVLGLTYYVLKDNGTDLLALGKQTDTTTGSETEDISTTTDSNTEEDNTESTTCEDTGTTNCEVSVDNEGWALFNVPEYKFSVELPSYQIKQQIGEEEVASVWKAWHSASLNGLPSYSDYLHSVNISFYPLYIPEGTGCGQGCVKEHTFRVEIYSNKGSKDLTSIKEQVDATWKTSYDENANLTWESSSKWGKDVWKFHAQLIGGSVNGYLVVTKDYVYDITYFISDNPAESAQVAQKVLDSMKFGE